MTGPYQPWRRKDLPARLRLSAAEVIAFDVLVHNDDRTAANPNLMSTHDEFLLIDHDRAFAFLRAGSNITEPGKTLRYSLVARHVFGQLARVKPGDLTEFSERVQLLTDDWLDDLERSTPPEWCAGKAKGWLGRMVEVLRERREHVEEWVGKLEESLRR